MSKVIGLLVIGVGVFLLFQAITADTSVSSPVGPVHNLGKMQEQQLQVIVSVGLMLIGTILLAAGYHGATFSQKNLAACPDCAELIQQEANVCRFCGCRFSDGVSDQTEDPTTPEP